MADDSQTPQPSFWHGLMAGLNDMPSNPLFNMGMGLMSAAKPFGNVGDSLMQAGQVTLANQAAKQKYGMGQLQMKQAQAEYPLRMAWLKNAMGALQPGQQQAPPGIAAPGQTAGPQMPMTPGIDPQQSVKLGLAGGALGMPGASEFLKAPGALESVQKYQQMQRQMAAQGPMALRKSVAGSAGADALVNNDQGLSAAYAQDAPRFGLPATPTPESARLWGALSHNELAGTAGLPSIDIPNQTLKVNRGNGDVRNIDPITGKDVGGSPAVATSKFVQNGQVVEMPTAQGVAQKLQPYDSALYAAGLITPQAKEQAYQLAKSKGDLTEAIAGRDPIAAGQLTSYIAKRAGEDGVSGLQLAANQQTFKARQGVVSDFLDPNGTAGGKLGAINTAVLHTRALLPLIDAMKNPNMTKLAAARQAYQKETGISAPTDYDALANMAIGEINSAVNSKTGGDSAERERLAAPFNSSRSPDVLKSAVKIASTALAGKTESLANQWDVGTEGTQGNFGKFLLPQTAETLGWKVHKDANGNKALVSPNGKYFKQL